MHYFYQAIRAIGALGVLVSIYYVIKFQLQLRNAGKERREMKVAIKHFQRNQEHLSDEW